MKTPGDSNKKNLSHQARETGALKGAGEWNLASVEHTYCSSVSVFSLGPLPNGLCPPTLQEWVFLISQLIHIPAPPPALGTYNAIKLRPKIPQHTFPLLVQDTYVVTKETGKSCLPAGCKD